MKKIISYIILGCIILLFCFPILFCFTGSFKGADELAVNLGSIFGGGQGSASWKLIPQYPTIRHYLKIVIDSPEFWTLFWNSIKITSLILVGQFVVGFPAAWGFARYNFKGKRAIFLMYIILMMMPFQVKMLSEYLTLDYLRLLDTHWGIILPACYSTFPVFIMYQFFVMIPSEVIEAAKVEGANDWVILWKIGLPMGKTGVFAAILLNFIEYWNIIEQPLVFLKTKALWTLSMYLPAVNREHIGATLVVSMIALLPPILLFLSGQEHIQKGIATMMN